MSRLMIDGQVHLFGAEDPNRPRVNASSSPWNSDFFAKNGLVTPENMVSLWDEIGVSTGVQVTPMFYGFDNSFSFEAAERSGDLIVVFGRFDPLAPHPRRRLIELANASPHLLAIRLTLHVEPARRLLDSPSTEFWAALVELKMPVAIYAPADLDKLVGVVERFPDLKLIVDHLGLGGHPRPPDPFEHFHLLGQLAVSPEVRVKISDAPQFSKDEYPFKDIHGQLAQALDWFGADRMIWGSDYPVITVKCSFEESINYLNEVPGFGDEELDQILGGTMQRVLDDARKQKPRWASFHDDFGVDRDPEGPR